MTRPQFRRIATTCRCRTALIDSTLQPLAKHTMPTERELARHWDRIGAKPDSFRDKNPILAQHKREVYRVLLNISHCAAGTGLILKTDLFAEAFNKEEFVSMQVEVLKAGHTAFRQHN